MKISSCLQKVGGAPGEIRTPDPQIRSLVLYPTELRARDRDARARRVACRELDGDRGEPTEFP